MINTATSTADLLRTHGFIHIPKTGGTSIEASLNATHAIIKRVHSHKSYGVSPWHLPVDVYESVYQKPYLRPTFCVVREPRERLESCIGMKFSNSFRTPLHTLPRVFAPGRHAVWWTEEFVHRMPQAWFVWDARGRVTCDCVVAFERLGNLTSVHSNRAQQPRALNLSDFPWELYARDALLHTLARESPTLCYRPPRIYV